MTMDHCLRGLFVFPPLVVVCLVTATALGQQRSDRFQGTSVAEFVQQRLATYDKDGDGKVSRDEAAGPMRGAFGRTDTNGDGFVDADELTVLAQRLRARQRPADREPSWRMPPVEGPNLHYRTFESATVGEAVSYLIYLPPGYDDSEERYPVVYWLHGIGGSQQGVPRMAERLTQAIEAGKTPPMIVVYVNGMIRSGYVDVPGKWPVETVSIQELIPHIDATYRTIATREGRAVEGFSMGGSGAANWGFKYPNLFGTVSILAGALHDVESLTRRDGGARLKEIYGGPDGYNKSNPWLLVEKNLDAIRGRTHIRIVVGELDGLKATNRRYHELLDKLGLEHEFHIVPDARHTPNPLYDGLGDRNWEFFAAAFNTAERTP